MLNKISSRWEIVYQTMPADSQDIASLQVKLPKIPTDYLELARDAGALEFLHQNGAYIRIWPPKRILELREAYTIFKYLPDAIPIGDEGGDAFIGYMEGNEGSGLYLADFGNINRDDAKFIAKSLSDLLIRDIGISVFEDRVDPG